MKTKILCFVAFAIISVCCRAQEDDYNLLNLAKKCLQNGECENAKKNYNAYTKVSKKRELDFEKALEACQPPTSATPNPKTQTKEPPKDTKTITNLKKQLQSANDSLETKRAEVARLKKQIINLQNQLKTQSDTLNSRTTESNYLKESLKGMDAEVENLNSLLREKEDIINEKNSTIGALEKQIIDQSNVIDALENAIKLNNKKEQ